MRQLSRRTILAGGAAALAGLMAPAAFAASSPIKLVALGDSLTAGLGLTAEEGFVPKLEAALKARGHDVSIANAGVSGDTATGGAERVDWSCPDGTDGVLLELGANDMLRGVDPTIVKAALTRILDRLDARKIPVMMLGMKAPGNLGEDYQTRFDAIYPDLAQSRGLVLYPFFLDGVAGDRSLNQPDGLHPNARGVDVIVGGLTPSVESFLQRISSARG